MDIENLLKRMVLQNKIKEKEPYKISIERKKKGDRRVEVIVQGNNAEIINAMPNLIKRLIKLGIDRNILKEMILATFERED